MTSTPGYPIYLILISCDRNGVKHNVFPWKTVGGSEKSRLCWVVDLKRASCVEWWIWKEPVVLSGGSEKSRFLFSRCSNWCSFAFVVACNHFLDWPTALSITFCDILARASLRRCFMSLVSQVGVFSCTHVPASLTTFSSQLDLGPDCLAATYLEIKCGVSYWRSWTVSWAWSDVRITSFLL